MKSEWSDIKLEPAPKDRYVFVWVKSIYNPNYGRYLESVCFKSGIWAHVNTSIGEYVSHWRPLFEPPEETRTSRIDIIGQNGNDGDHYDQTQEKQ